MAKDNIDNYMLQEQIAIKQNLELSKKISKLNKMFRDAGMVSCVLMILHDDVTVVIDPNETEQATKMVNEVLGICLT